MSSWYMTYKSACYDITQNVPSVTPYTGWSSLKIFQKLESSGGCIKSIQPLSCGIKNGGCAVISKGISSIKEIVIGFSWIYDLNPFFYAVSKSS